MRKIKFVAFFSFAICCGTVGYLGWRVIHSGRVRSVLNYTKRALFSNVSFKTKDAYDNAVTINALEVQKHDDWFILTKPDIIVHRKGNTIRVKSAQLETDKRICKLKSNVVIKIADNINLKTEYGYVDIKRQFAKADNHVYIMYDNIEAQSDRYLLNMQQSMIDLQKNVKISSADKVLTGDHFRCYFKDKDGMKYVDKASINGNVIYKSNTHNFTTKGIVSFYKNTVCFRSHTTMHGVTGKRKYKLETGAADILLFNNQFQRVTCKNKFKLFIDNNVVSGDIGVIENDIINVIGNVVIKTPQGVARGQKARYNIKAGKLVMQNVGGILFRKKKNGAI